VSEADDYAARLAALEADVRELNGPLDNPGPYAAAAQA
jgi:hypothetical protein